MMQTFKILLGVSLLWTMACAPADNTNNPPTANVPTEAPKVETKCFLRTEGDKNQDSTTVSLSFSGNLVSGNMDWLPFEKDGAHGAIEATLEGDKIKGIFRYIIEGSRQSEEVEFQIIGNNLVQKEAELVEKIPGQGDLVFKDPAKGDFTKVFKEVACPK